MSKPSLDNLRWWTFAKSETEALQILRQCAERDAALGFAPGTTHA